MQQCSWLTRDRRVQWAAIAVLAAYWASVVARAWVDPSGAHGQRQMDTGGMSLALALDLKREGLAALWRSLAYPRVLDRGLSSGINVAEFPLLNALTGPFFLLGPHAGSVLATLAIALANLWASVVATPRLARLWGAEVPRWLCALIYVAIGSIAFQAPILMPEGLSFPLLLLGSCWTCESVERGWKPALAGAIALSLAIAVKPTAVVGLILPALYPALRPPGARSQHAESAARAAPLYAALAASIAFPAWWYALHARALESLADGPQVFARARLEPLQRLGEVGLGGALRLIARQLNEWQFPYWCGALWTAIAAWRERALLLALLAALLGAIALDGSHIWPHFYYFFGAGLVSLALVPRILASPALPRRIGALCLATLLWSALYSIRSNVWVTARTPDWWTLAARARPLLPPDAHVVTDDEVDPTKLFYLGRLGSIEGPGALSVCDREPFRSHTLAIVVNPDTYARARAAAASCLRSEGTRLVGEPVAPAGKWMVLVYSPMGPRAAR